MEKSSDVFTVERLAKILGVDSPETWLDRYDSFSDPYYDPKCSEEENQKFADDERDAAFTKYVEAIVTVAERLFAEHGLLLVERKTRKLGTVYRIVPKEGWKHAASEVIQTINGVGYFWFNSPKELRESGPYCSYKQATLHHVGWISDHPRVYGNGTASGMVERELRY